jgi:Nuclease-related domain
MRELIKGWLGEKMTALGVWLKLDPEVYRRIHNVILPARNGTTQIDHVVVSIYGLFVIETKNMDGSSDLLSKRRGHSNSSRRSLNFRTRCDRIIGIHGASRNFLISTMICYIQ